MSTTPAVTVILINRSLPYNCIGKLTGYSGMEYGHSTYEPAFGAHVCRLPLDAWEKCAKDVTLGAQRRWAQWEAHFEMADAPVGGEDVMERVRLADKDQLDAIVSGLSPLVRAVYARAKEIGWHRPEALQGAEVMAGTVFKESTSPAAPHQADDLDQVTNFRKLLQMANAAGVTNADSIDTSAGLREAIRAVRPAAAPQSIGVERHEYQGRTDGKMVDLPDPPQPKAPAFQGGKTT